MSALVVGMLVAGQVVLGVCRLYAMNRGWRPRIRAVG
jgi:hypothetical protein